MTSLLHLRVNTDFGKMSELTVFCTTYNTGLQGSMAQEQDLASWLIPVLHETTQENYDQLPDIYAIGVEELLPLHLACELPQSWARS